MKTVEETRRELFESLFPDEKVYWNGLGYFPMPNSGLADGVLGYCLTREKHLEIFNAALDAVVIKLPEFISSYNTDMNGYTNPSAIEYDSCIEDCKESIDSLNLGIKVK